MVRRPSVAAAIETASRGRLHADVELGLDVDAHAVRVMSASSLARTTPIGSTFMLTGVMSWMIGSTKAPPSITTFSPRKPVRTKETSFDERR